MAPHIFILKLFFHALLAVYQSLISFLGRFFSFLEEFFSSFRESELQGVISYLSHDKVSVAFACFTAVKDERILALCFECRIISEQIPVSDLTACFISSMDLSIPALIPWLIQGAYAIIRMVRHSFQLL